MLDQPRLAGIEAGGTTFRCALSTIDLQVSESTTIPTRSPAETLADVVDFFRRDRQRIAAVGIGSFGPLDRNPQSPTYGHITSTPKPGWQGVDVLGIIRSALDVTVIGIDTDVNAAAIAEHYWGAARGMASSAYITVGTGIGAGLVIDHRVVGGLVHPEFGHIRVPHDRSLDPYDGCCPAHGDCLEGLASGTAIAKRWSSNPREFSDDHPAWALTAGYLASGIAALVYTVSPHRIIVGGGIAGRLDWTALLPEVRRILGDYLDVPELTNRIDRYIVRPQLGAEAGLIGALALARSALAPGDSLDAVAVIPGWHLGSDTPPLAAAERP